LGNTPLRSGLLFQSQWLIRTGLMGLVDAMMRLSREYGFPWAASWPYHLGNPDWLSRAMAQTFMLLTPKDKDTVRAQYDDWLWYQNNLDMHKMANPEFNALCYLLDRKGNRVSNDKGEVTVLRGLKGQDKQEALKTLDLRCYEFIDWW
jgi:hypothetical protein